jgi:hypothetical protein
MDKQPDHWLYRFTCDEWLTAAENETARAKDAFLGKQQRAGVTGARRAAGMAWNAVLCTQLDEKFGRSYMEHLQALARDDSQPADVQRAAHVLVAAPLKSELIQLGAGDTSLIDAVDTIVARARAIMTERQ